MNIKYFFEYAIMGRVVVRLHYVDILHVAAAFFILFFDQLHKKYSFS